MSTHALSARNAIADAVVDLVDVGSTNAQGRIFVYTDNRVSLLATILLPNPAFGTASVGIATANGLPLSDSLADASGTAAIFDIVDRDENIIFSGTIGTSNADMIVPDTEIAANDIVKIISLSYTAPP